MIRAGQGHIRWIFRDYYRDPLFPHPGQPAQRAEVPGVPLPRAMPGQTPFRWKQDVLTAVIAAREK
ncbi:hypothetical protein GCM10010140_72910 [Streptosporangium pseudovulgare]|uniref:Transposase n=1 Tax=Streptosporangium pseudovulgare TaxID=35765 RepID=A0ABQ2RHC7_9ACTN|nr:hypothetical protein GCM10010140_72910 [Streptosporangium pseudovulgare]